MIFHDSRLLDLAVLTKELSAISMHLLKKVSLRENFSFASAGGIFVLATMLIGTAPTAQAHEDHGTNVVLDISRTNNTFVVLQFVTQANKKFSIQYLSSFVSTNVSGTNVVSGIWSDLQVFPAFPFAVRYTLPYPTTNLSRLYRLKIF